MGSNSKHIIITGASRGIGFQLVKLLAEQGHQVLGISRTIHALQPIAQECSNLEVISADISELHGLEEVEKFISSNWKKVDILIHNAGSLVNKPFADTTIEDFLKVYKVNVFAVADLTRQLLPWLTKGSHVIAISSMGGIQGSMKFPGLAAYSSSKGAVITLMELLAEEYKSEGISFNTLAIGAVQTEMLEEAFPGYQAPISAKEMARYIADFALTGNTYYNGKVLQVSSSTP